MWRTSGKPVSIEHLMRVLLLNLAVDSLRAANKSLGSQGYDVATHHGLAVDQILTLSPEVLVTEATPSDLSCCGLITQLKARLETESSLKIVMIVQGGAVERARALDLGADDVISFPFEPLEFAARIRAQFRERKPQEEFKTMLKYAVQREHFADIVLQLLSRPLGKRRFWLPPAIFVLSAAAVLAAIDLADSLKRQLADTQHRLKLLESEGKIAETVVHDFGTSVCLLHVVVEFLDKQSGHPIQVAVDAGGKPLVDDKGMVQLADGGAGPHLQIDGFGTGFLVKRDGKIITNHHVVEPWWKDEDLKQLLDQGAIAYVLFYEVYFPGKVERLRAKLDRISSKADVATLQLESPLPPNSAVLELDDRTEATVTGDPVVLIGYPTGIEGILARAGADVTRKIAGGNQDVNRIMSQLASQRLIRPTTTQGHTGDVLEDKIVYDAATTSGGSGPLFNREGKVIGINFAVLRDFGGSNLAVPVKYAKDLLK